MHERLLEHSSGVSVRYFQGLLNHERADLINEPLTDSKLEDYGTLKGGGMAGGKRSPRHVHLDSAHPPTLVSSFLLPHPSAFMFCFPTALKASDHELKHLKLENKFPP